MDTSLASEARGWCQCFNRRGPPLHHAVVLDSVDGLLAHGRGAEQGVGHHGVGVGDGEEHDGRSNDRWKYELQPPRHLCLQRASSAGNQRNPVVTCGRVINSEISHVSHFSSTVAERLALSRSLAGVKQRNRNIHADVSYDRRQANPIATLHLAPPRLPRSLPTLSRSRSPEVVGPSK